MKEEFILSLIDKFNDSTAVSLKLSIGESVIQLKKAEAFIKPAVIVPGTAVAASGAVPSQAAPVSPASGNPADVSAANTPAEGPAKTPVSENEAIIKSPIVSTFYRAPSPDSPAYVEEGQTVRQGQPLCILEAMKMLNNLEAEFPCVIEKILAANGELVEYDQPLFMVRKI
ncbi:MAG: acetyl-CoA carboxylase biotin carboxyl carrier protein [Spirochaetaceae bacterium]|jgi:acetyl-CoA carboxylase biotin carboxyl carrier protein|nr:acetyl-CoA carboxylase biotin carboxyl carrier protein [Spirochaetaceae bacterium]